MRLAQTKSLNSYTFSDCLSFLNYVWADIYSQICTVDSGYYSRTVRLTKRLTRLPRFVRNSLTVYSAQSPLGHDRLVYRSAGETDLSSRGVYRISGSDLWCADAERTAVWLEYCPQPPQVFFTHHNRDPKVHPDGHDTVRRSLYAVKRLVGDGGLDVSDPAVTREDIAAVRSWRLVHRNMAAGMRDEDITGHVLRDEDEDGRWELVYISCDFPYIFCSYRHSVTGEFKSGFFDRNMEWTDYNPFEWTGRNDNVEYVSCAYNDKTGLGVVVLDWNDMDVRLLNTERLPDTGGVVLRVENAFEYKGDDGTVLKMAQGWWYNRFPNDFSWERAAEAAALPPSAEDGEVVVVGGVPWRHDSASGAWGEVTDVKRVAQREERPRCKELGWTPDTRLVYPAPEVYRYLVARLAEKFASLNESSIMGVQSELVDARFAFQAFLRKDKSAWERMRNVNPATAADWL